MSEKNSTDLKDEGKQSSYKLGWKQKIAYGFGDFGNGFMFDLGQSYLTKFFTDVAMIAPGMVGLIFSVTKIFDAFMDPLAGSFIDSRKNVGKAGKFRPIMMISAIVLAIMTVVTFTMPNVSTTGKVVFAFGAYAIWGLVYSFTNVPYGSLASVMTRDVEDRAHLATTRMAGSLGAQLITSVAFIPIVIMFSTSKVHLSGHGYTIAAAVMALIGVVGFAICYLGTRENIKVYRAEDDKNKRKEHSGFKDYFKVVFTNKPLGAIIILTLFAISGLQTTNTMMVYFCEYNLGNIGLQPTVSGIMVGTSVIAIFAIPFLVKKFGKKKTTVVSLIIGALADGLNFVLPTNTPTFIALITVGYVALAIPNGITWAFVTDVIDYGEWHTGIRKEGITYAAFNFSRKLAQSLAAIISAGILGLTGYVANAQQSSGTLLGIKGAMTLYPAIVLLLAALGMFMLYGLTDNKYRQIADDLSHGKWENGMIGQDTINDK